jgi:mono/diheme cytochrome c family protein
VTRGPWLLLAALLAAAAPSAAQDARATQATGAQLFAARCGMCHRAGGMGTGLLSRRPDGGTGLLEERRDLLAPFVQAVVRAGTGNMPRIARGEVSDAELARIAAYLAKEPVR